MKKAFDQTVRDLKREVNKKVLKIPGIEQKILDATSNEPWGPHGSHLADIAQATRNIHEYQIIMHIIWKRINDTGKNWRHVYKGLIVLEYLVANGSERVIDEIREHSYPILTLSNFQYIDSSGRDQGSNIRRKSQSLVALVNDKERIQEVRLKALANRDKYCSTFSTGGTYRPSSYSSTGGYGDRYDDDHYDVRSGSRDEDWNGYGRERERPYGDDDRYGRSGDPCSREGDRYGRGFDDRYGRESHRYDGYRGNHSNEDYQYGSRNRSFDRDRDRSFDDDDRYSSRSGGGRADDPSQDERIFKHKISEQNVGTPPSYEEVTRDAQPHMQEEKNGGNVAAAAPKASPPSVPKASSPSKGTGQISDNAVPGLPASTESKDVDGFDDFDPRGCVSVALPAASSLERDLFGSLSPSDPINPLAMAPVTSTTITAEADFSANLGSGTDFVCLSSASHVLSQPSEDPFGEPPFKATQESFPAQQLNFAPVTSVQLPSSATEGAEPSMPSATKMETAASFDFGDSFGGITYTRSVTNGQQPPFASPANLGPAVPAGTNVTGALRPQAGTAASIPLQATQPAAPTNIQTTHSNLLLPQLMPPAPSGSQAAPFTAQAAQPTAPTNMQAGPHMNFLSQSGLSGPTYPVGAAPTSALPQVKIQPSKEKFETKSTVWADTLSRGLVNLNISGPKINPHADIGIDFDSINRKEKRKDEKKSSAALATSTATMGKAMGAGSGIGRTGTSGLAPPPNPMMGSGMAMGVGMGMGGGAGTGMGMVIGGYGGGMNPLMGMGMGMGMNMGMGRGMGMPMRLPTGMAASGPGMHGAGYNPMMGMDSYGPQQPYGGYR